MILTTLHVRDRRALVVGAAAMIVLVVGFRGLPAWELWRSAARSNASEIMTRAERTSSLLTAFPRALDTLQARRTQVTAMGPILLTDETAPGAASNLTAFIGELARLSAVRIDAVELHVDSSKARVLPLIRVNLQATTDIAGLSAFLQGLEQGPTLLAVRRLGIHPQNADANGAQGEMLSVQVAVEGLALVRVPGKAP
jgi:type II secretion system (T2SS) protein M